MHVEHPNMRQDGNLDLDPNVPFYVCTTFNGQNTDREVEVQLKLDTQALYQAKISDKIVTQNDVVHF